MILTVASLKGGVGKTSLAVFLAQALRKHGKVLCVDLDPNNNATDFFLRHADPEAIEQKNVFHVLRGTERLSDCIHKAGLPVLPCTPELHKAGQELGTKPAALMRFQKAIKESGFDFVVIDTPPALVYELRAGIYVADLVLSPLQYNRWSFQNLELLRLEIEDAREAPCPLLVVPSIVTQAENERLRNMFPDLEFSQASITKSAAIRNAGNKATPLRESSKSHGQFESLSKEVQKFSELLKT